MLGAPSFHWCDTHGFPCSLGDLWWRMWLGGGFKYVLFSPRKLGKWSILTNIFQRGWNHQLGDDSVLLQSAHPTVQSGLAEVQSGSFMKGIRKHKLTQGTFIGMGSASLIFLVWEFTFNLTKYRTTEVTDVSPESPGMGDRWWLIIMSAMIQVVSGSVYGMGAWQDDLRDSLNISMTGATIIGAMTFMGNLAGFLGGMIFDNCGPKVAVCLGSTCLSIGYCFIGFALASEAGNDSEKICVP